MLLCARLRLMMLSVRSPSAHDVVCALAFGSRAFPNSPPPAAAGGDQVGEGTAERSEAKFGGRGFAGCPMSRELPREKLEIQGERSTTPYPSPNGLRYFPPLRGGLFREIGCPLPSATGLRYFPPLRWGLFRSGSDGMSGFFDR